MLLILLLLVRLPLRFHEFCALGATWVRLAWIGAGLAAIGKFPIARANQCPGVQVLPLR